MKCRACGAELQDGWAFCPYCGSKNAPSPLRQLDDALNVFEQSVKNIFSDVANFPFGKGFIVEISQEKGEPKVSIKDFDEFSEALRSRRVAPRDPEVVEPEVSVERNGRLIRVKMPGVKSEKDVTIKKLGNSLEVHARAGGRRYFAVIPVKYRRIAGKEFSKSVLEIRLR
ncbi:MAG: zinc ribbon domain-containing protein [Euryarchaeota archaeon]|nr:zinc ribbon domain-containing protein [Euryarchaeota archaeon]